ncbi:MAG: glycosyltransferase [Candidatus Sumerlaeaceae bacterium]
MSRPRVLHVYKDYYPPVLGGIEATINLMARGTLDACDVTVLVCSGGRTRSDEVIDGVRVVRVPELGRLSSAPVSPAFPSELRRLARKADLLHVHHPNPTGDVSCLLVRPAAPIVMTYHSDVVRQKKAMWLYGAVQERMMRRCKVIMPTSPNYIESSDWLQRHAEKCIVVPLGIDLARFEKTTETESSATIVRQKYPGPITIFVGRLRYYKGLEFLVRAMPQIPGTLLIIGTGPESDRLQSLIAETGLLNRVHLLGDQDESQLVAHLHAADAFCMPSHLRSEAFGLSQVEAMACALPVVSTTIPTGVPFVNHDGVTGFSVEPASPDALAQALNRIYSNPHLRTQMGAAARQRAVTTFNAARMCADLKRVYSQVLGSTTAE